MKFTAMILFAGTTFPAIAEAQYPVGQGPGYSPPLQQAPVWTPPVTGAPAPYTPPPQSSYVPAPVYSAPVTGSVRPAYPR